MQTNVKKNKQVIGETVLELSAIAPEKNALIKQCYK